MLKRFIFLSLLVCLLLPSCFIPESLGSFDSDTWKADRYGCNGKRQELAQEFEKIKHALYGQREVIARKVLGKPDQEELLAGNQRLYFYYLEAGEQCNDHRIRSDANWVEVRINAVGKVSEVSYKYPTTTGKPE